MDFRFVGIGFSAKIVAKIMNVNAFSVCLIMDFRSCLGSSFSVLLIFADVVCCFAGVFALVLILQDSVEEKDDEITRLKQELQHRSIVEEEKTEVASDKKDGDIDGGMLCPEAETEITKHKASTVVNEIKEYLDFPPNFIEIVEPLGRQVQELPVLLLRAIGLPLGLQQLKHKRAASTDIGTPGEEIAADKSFEEAGFAAALAADDGDLSDLDRGLATELSKDVLKLVDDWGSQVAQRSSI
ncbi:hypothetical protein LOK49_LG12G01059 [Camellia lanceoleosa]|uniref:Uncharacterized protein n=1 Tax=Camellia lanceoleosa TaxID=1840588 RepID=A0ACC0FQP1_9ERIC|nr:hypothetical protein LOK49_LG12G01059 [Camellia lanceoleosa]